MNKSLKLLIAGSALFAITACQIDKPVQEDRGYVIKNKFDATEAAQQILGEGTSTIKGNAFLRQKGGTVVTCAGSEVTLTPYTEYANERMQVIYGSSTKGSVSLLRRVKWANSNPDYHTYSKSTICDSDGKFEFADIKEGAYFVTTTVSWIVPTKIGKSYYDKKVGGILMQKVQINKGKTKNIILTD